MEETHGGSDRITWPQARIALAASFGAFLTNIAMTTINVAIDRLIIELDSTLAAIQWVSTGYLLTLSLVLPLMRWAATRVGMKRLYLWCLFGFALTSALCGLAWSAGSLIAFRALQGAVGGLLAPMFQTMIAQLARPTQIGRMMNIVGIPILLSPLLGPLVGGFLIESLSWRWIFLINTPLALWGIWYAWRRLPADAKPIPTPLDMTGMLLICPGLALVTYGISAFGHTGTLNDWTVLVPTLGGILLVMGFAVHALRRGETALLDLRLFHEPVFTACAVTVFVMGIGSLGGQLILPLYYQQAGGQSALDAGLLLAPQGLGLMLSAPVSGRLADQANPGKVLIAGLLLIVIGTLPFAFASYDPPYWLLSLALVLRGVGIGTMMTPALTVAYRRLPKHAIPNATTVISMIQRFGAPIGTALMAVVVQWRFGIEVASLPKDAALAAAFSQTFILNIAVFLPGLFAGLVLMRTSAARPR